jgi:hypothetical protein
VATFDQAGNVVQAEPIQELEEVVVTAPRPVPFVAINWNVVALAAVLAVIGYVVSEEVKPARRRKRR